MALSIRCIRCGGPHLVWECPSTKETKEPVNEPGPARFDKVAYQREYMRKRRRAAKGDRGAAGC